MQRPKAAAMTSTLGELFAGIAAVPASAVGLRVSGLAYDSRTVESGTLFCCVPGFQVDGHDFAARAVADGAAGLLVERPLDLGVPEVVVPSVRAAMGRVAARFYRDPTAELRVVGVTGTNGKTTSAYLARALLEAAGVQTGLLGTVKSVVGGVQRLDRIGETHARGGHLPVGQRTTPEAIDLQRDFRAMLDAGDRACSIEVSSHALALGRASGIEFAAAIFTNLTQDHLDFHPTMEDYFLAKRSLFLPEVGAARARDLEGLATMVAMTGQRAPGVSVINIGDPYGRRLASEVPDPVTFAVEADADYSARDLSCDASECRFQLSTPAGVHNVALRMPGRFNVANALGAVAAVHKLGYDLDTLVAAMRRGVRVPGRFEPVDAGQEFAVVVDYAHTPDSLENVLLAARDLVSGRVLCVFGAGGDRDRAKRPLMGAIAARLADVAIVTSDNPRSEDPEAIVAEIVAGIDGSAMVEVDRRRAIESAIELADRGDMVVIAGKGHEQGQEMADGVKLPFDDATVARAALEAAGARV